MKKTFKELTPTEALKRLAESGKPIEGLYFYGDGEVQPEGPQMLRGIDIGTTKKAFYSEGWWYNICAELIEEVPQPWTFDTAPKGCVLIRIKDEPHATLITHWQRSGVMFGDGAGMVNYGALAGPWQHSLDNGKTWLPCTQ